MTSTLELLTLIERIAGANEGADASR